jgi:hypothetical protein
VRRLIWPALILAAAAPLAAAAAPPGEVAAPEGESLRLARKLVGTINPYGLLVEVNVRAWEATITQMVAAAPPVQKLEAAYPGITKGGIDAARPLARRYCEDFVRDSLETKARLFAEGLSQAEMLEGIAFYASPAGQRMIKGFAANADVQEMGRRLTAEARETGNAKVTQEMTTDLQNKAIWETAKEISAADQLEVMRFSQKPAAVKKARLAAEADRQLLAELTKPHPEWEAGQSAAMNNAMLAFVDARKKP